MDHVHAVAREGQQGPPQKHRPSRTRVDRRPRSSHARVEVPRHAVLLHDRQLVLQPPVPPRDPSSRRDRASARQARRSREARIAVLQRVRARRRRAHGSGQEHLLHGSQEGPHGAQPEAVRLHAVVTIGRRSVRGDESLQGHDLPAHRDVG